jgi:hypothetical protein
MIQGNMSCPSLARVSHSFSFEIREENGILKLVANPEYIDLIQITLSQIPTFSSGFSG